MININKKKSLESKLDSPDLINIAKKKSLQSKIKKEEQPV